MAQRGLWTFMDWNYEKKVETCFNKCMMRAMVEEDVCERYRIGWVKGQVLSLERSD